MNEIIKYSFFVLLLFFSILIWYSSKLLCVSVVHSFLLPSSIPFCGCISGYSPKPLIYNWAYYVNELCHPIAWIPWKLLLLVTLVKSHFWNQKAKGWMESHTEDGTLPRRSVSPASTYYLPITTAWNWEFVIFTLYSKSVQQSVLINNDWTKD